MCGKIVVIVLSNWFNIKNTINIHLGKKHYTYVAHRLNLSINKDILSSEDLKELQTQMGLYLLKVIQDMSIRWNSSFHILETLVQFKAPLTAVITFLPHVAEYLIVLESEFITDCIPVLKPFVVMAIELFGEMYLTHSSVVIPLVRDLLHTSKSIITKTTTGNLLQKTSIYIIRRLISLEFIKIITNQNFQDPRFKKAEVELTKNGRTRTYRRIVYRRSLFYFKLADFPSFARINF